MQLTPANRAKKDKEHLAQIRKALKNKVVDDMGYIVIGKTLETNGVYKSHYKIALLRSEAERLGMKIHAKKSADDYHKRGGSSICHSLPFGPKTKKLTWEEVKKPAIYAIVNKVTKRMYIGVSKSPTLRRAVHYYYLRNIDSDKVGNIFKHNEQIRQDLEEHGLESFHMEILVHLPEGMTRTERFHTEQAFIKTQPQKKLYNVEGMKVYMGKKRGAPKGPRRPKELYA